MTGIVWSLKAEQILLEMGHEWGNRSLSLVGFLLATS